MRRMLGAMVTAGVVLAVPFAAKATAEVLRVVFADGRPPASLPLQRLEAQSLEWYVGANDLARALDLERFWKPETGKLVLKVGTQRLQVTVDTRLVLVDEDDKLLHCPVRYRNGSVVLPLEFVESLLVTAAGPHWVFDRAALTLTVGKGASDVLGIDYGGTGGDTEVRVRLARACQHRVQATSRALVRVRLFDMLVDPLALVADTPAPLVRSVRAEQRGRDATLYLELDANVDGFDADMREDGRLLVITLHRQLEPMPQPEFKLPVAAAPEAAPVAERGCRVLVIDAGHGGDDVGVQASGLAEKDVTLELAGRLRPRLEAALQMRVVLLRNGDRALSDDRRAEAANKSGGDLLVSLHCNGAFAPMTSGFEVLFAGAGEAAEAGGGDDFRPWRSAQRPYAARSRAFAQILQTELQKQLTLPNRGAREASLAFLRGVAMPAVVVETGFLTNGAEADALQAPEFAERLAAGIIAAVQRYCAQDDGRLGGGDLPGGVAVGH